jgi:hypothetical protein
MSQISVPLFRSNNTEKLELVDAYDIADTRPVNKLFDSVKKTASAAATAVFDRAGGITGLISGVDRLLAAKKQGIAGVELLNQSLGMFGSSAGALLRTAGNGILDKAGEYLDIDPTLATKIKNAGESVIDIATYGDLTQISQYGELTELMGALTGNEEIARVINVGYESAVWASVFSQSNQYGVYSSYGRVRDNIDPDVYRQAVILSIPSVASSGSLEAVQAVLEVIDGDVLLARQPSFVRVFLSAFDLPSTVSNDLVSYSDTVVSTLNQIDPSWYQYTLVSGEVIYDLEALVGASDDAINLLTLHGEVGKLVQVAPDFPMRSVADIIRDEFPMMVTA